ncbi:MAG: DUF455 family protein [Chloroflexi bacterium]|uniref:DUF455 family protein n=1 Tax=Candidatus Flexifilum breve TaxID=3140694 RepID=UPI0031349BB9|nr:DUF455 family protein [Chloroflexota bacterium]
MQQTEFLPGNHERGRYMRMDTAQILKRFFFCERALIIAQAGWIAGLAPLEIKIELPRMFWEDALVADALRTRVFELRYPSRLLEIADDAPVVSLFEAAKDAPSGAAFLLALARVYKPALLTAYQAYLGMADTIADGPTVHFLRTAVADKQRQIQQLEQFASAFLQHAAPAEIDEAHAWVNALRRQLDAVGLGLDAPRAVEHDMVTPLRKSFQFAEIPARDARFAQVRYYWPNVIDSSFPYGDGMMLQLRSAVSHLNEVWAVETGGAILYFFADALDWEFVVDAARWTYDEARHTQMGYARLIGWGFQPEELPLGTYIYDAARGQDPIIRLGMLHYFETKNIGKKHDRAAAFASYHDDVSQHDMEFDWADETIHAHYGSKWLAALREKFPSLPDRETLHNRCDQLVEQVVAEAVETDRQAIYAVTEAMVAKANHRLTLV